MPRPDEQPQWQPISRLPLIASHIDEWLINTEEQYATLLPARERPHALDDYTVGRVIKVFTEQKNDLWLWETQIARWKKDDLTGAQRQEVERLDGQLAKVREMIDSILALAKELSEGTIEKVLAKSDFELWLEVLLGKRKLMTTKKHRRRTQKGAKVSGSQSGFRLPPDVSFSKQLLPYGWAYVFRHRSLGDLGRIVLEETGDGRTRLSLEVLGDPADPMTAERAAVFQPLGMELARQMEAMTGPTPAAVPFSPPPRPPEPKSRVSYCTSSFRSNGERRAPASTSAMSFDD